MDNRTYVYDIKIAWLFTKHFVAEFKAEVKRGDVVRLKGIAYEVISIMRNSEGIADRLTVRPRLATHYRLPIKEREVFD